MMANRMFHKRFFKLYLFIILLGTTTPSTKAVFRKEYVPKYKVEDLPFDTKPDHRGYWCDKQLLMNNKTLSLERALENETISLVIPRGSNFINFENKETGVISSKDPGLLINLLDIIAERGGFKWEYGVVDYNPIYVNDDYNLNELLVWAADNFDVVVDWWLQLPSRVEFGLSYPRGWYDGSIIAIGHRIEVDNSFSLLSWKQPFTDQVWLLLIITLLLSAFLCYVLEAGLIMPKFNLDELSTFFIDVTDHIYMTFLVFTGHMQMKTTSKSGQLVSFALSFFAMLMIAAYTANMASYLVVKNTQRTVINGVAHIVELEKSMCIIDGGKKLAIVKRHPDAKFVIKLSENEVFEGLDKYDCDYAISSISAWDEIKEKKGYNWGCKMDRVGRVFETFEAGFVMKSDSGIQCTSMVRDVFHVQLLNMWAEGIVDNQWDMHKRKNQDTRSGCDISSINELQVLDIRNMGGIFVCHFSAIAIAILCALGGKWYNKRWGQSILVNKSSIIDNNDNNQTSTKEFHNLAQSDGGSHRGSCMLEEFPFNENASKKRVIFNKTVNTSNRSNVLLEDPAAKEKLSTKSSRSSFDPELNKSVDELASDVNDLRQKVGLVLERLDIMAPRS